VALVADVRGSADGFIAAADAMPAVPALGVSRAGAQLTARARWRQIGLGRADVMHSVGGENAATASASPVLQAA